MEAVHVNTRMFIFLPVVNNKPLIQIRFVFILVEIVIFLISVTI